MITLSNASLENYNSFQVAAHCKNLIKVYSDRDIYDALITYDAPFHIIGGGSNILLVDDINGTVIRNEIKGIEIVDEDESQVMVSVGAGENWHNLVLWSISHHLSGLQNLSLIPGSVGAAPIQNIGAYGVEQSDCFHSLRAIALDTGLSRIFYKDDCKFGYRESLFKSELAGKYITTHVTYMLSKTVDVNVSYGDIKKVLDEQYIDTPTLKELSDAICAIRSSKLPDPIKIGNAGSFFKNPIVSEEKYESLLIDYPEIVAFPFGDQFKLSAGWLIDFAGWKGKSVNGAKVYDRHALVLVNDGTKNGGDIWSLAMQIQQDILQKYGVDIIPEVNVWGK